MARSTSIGELALTLLNVGGVNFRFPVLILSLALAALLTLACDGGAVEPQAVATAYVEDAAFRRQVLEQALWQPELPYSRGLLGSYGLETGGWELLPTTASLSLDGPTPTTHQEWLAAGEKAFYELPMRRDGYVDWLVERPELWDSVGLEKRADGSVRGLVSYVDAAGIDRVGISCSLCHAKGGHAGFSSRSLDLGLARALYRQAQGLEPGQPGTWGPGRIDVTDDGVNGPTAIPDLWGMKYAGHMNHSGAIEIGGVKAATLAVRFETQIILGHRMEARPDRRLTWALAQFVLSLEPPPGDASAAPADDVAAGRDVFEQRCAGCHNPDHGFAGGLVHSDMLTSDPTVATTPERGTGYYKVPSLVGVRFGAPYLHDGSAPTLDALLVSGHPSGAALDDLSRTQLTEFLSTL